jgi:type V secretory pathway adhesin AidA
MISTIWITQVRGQNYYNVKLKYDVSETINLKITYGGLNILALYNTQDKYNHFLIKGKSLIKIEQKTTNHRNWLLVIIENKIGTDLIYTLNIIKNNKEHKQ